MRNVLVTICPVLLSSRCAWLRPLVREDAIGCFRRLREGGITPPVARRLTQAPARPGQPQWQPVRQAGRQRIAPGPRARAAHCQRPSYRRTHFSTHNIPAPQPPVSLRAALAPPSRVLIHSPRRASDRPKPPIVPAMPCPLSESARRGLRLDHLPYLASTIKRKERKS